MIAVVDEEALSLIRDARRGDRDAFARLAASDWRRLVRLARTIVADLNAEDVAQEGLAQAWKRVPALRSRVAFSDWLAGIVVTLALRRVDRSARSVLSATDSEADQTDVERTSSEVQDVLRLLSPRQRAVLHLSTIDAKKDSEIAAMLGMAPSSVRVERLRARQRLESILKGEQA
jgi:RNA polymerase sigma factor (sigma-70 family)